MSECGFEDRIPCAGLEWAGDLALPIVEKIDQIPLIELIPENFFGQRNQKYKEQFYQIVTERNIPIIVHSVALSLCSIEPLKQTHLDEVKAIAKNLPVLSFSDHLCMTEMGNVDIGQLTSSIYNDDTLNAVVDKIKAIQKQLHRPFAFENITHTFQLPEQKYKETEFINLIIERTGSKLLLDLNNIYTNGVNFGIDPYRYLEELDLDQIDSIHLAGGFFDDEHMLQDGHCEKVPPEVWKLYEVVLDQAKRPIWTVVERTGNNRHGLAPILEDMHTAQALLDERFGNSVALSGLKTRVASTASQFEEVRS